MRIDDKNKLDYFKELYADATSRLQQEEKLRQALEQYKGSKKIDDSIEDAKTIRNITYELIESQVTSHIPPAAVAPEIWSEHNERNAKNIEELLRNLRNKLPFEKMNDIDERYTPIYGGSVWLVEWDNSILTHNTVGDVKVSIWSPEHFVGQPNIYDINDMEYCFISFETTKEDLVRKYDVSFEKAEETTSDTGDDSDETATVIVCYYKNNEDRVCQYIWSDDTELLDIDDYYSRKKYICSSCGKRKELCDCDKPMYEMENEEYEELAHDIALQDGVLPAISQVIKDGQIVMERKQTQAILENGTVAMDNSVGGILIPQVIEVNVPKLEKTKLPYYTPKLFPIVIRKNISEEDNLYGQSDCEFIRPQQQAINKIESRILEKLISAGVYPLVPEDFEGQLDNSIFKKVFRAKANTYKLFGRIDLQANIALDIAQSDRLYDHAKRILGISDSFQGHQDRTASSGIAKQIQVSQTAGRLDSKRKMKNAAYAEIDAIIYQLYLAYADEPRAIAFKDANSRLQNAIFNRYEFIERDENGDYYYNDSYLFATDAAADVEKNRELLWQENRLNFQSGCYGEPSMIETLLIFWQNMEKAHYPNARDNVERLRTIIDTQQAQMQQQLLVQQQQQTQQQQTNQQIQQQQTNQQNGGLL